MVQAGGPDWEVPLGRRDSKGASISASNNDIPAPNNTFQTILSRFNSKGLDLLDLVALSGSFHIPFFCHNIFSNYNSLFACSKQSTTQFNFQRDGA